ncbi:hypothetical protein D3C87_1926080 [compost metagenome]
MNVTKSEEGISLQFASILAVNGVAVVGPVLSSTLITCEAVEKLPETSVAVQVLVIV